MIYRKDIDGLRSIAVLPVLFFHFGWTLFAGGYVGVDIFFVLSGYLITSIITEEIKQDKFTIVGFYERRIRRIYPALFTVILVTAIASYLLMLPQELKDVGQSIVATNIFSSNILFWLESDYFDAESLSKPLLHTWSLAIEEQFYFIFPLLLLFTYRLFKSFCVPLLLILWIASLLTSVWLVEYKPSSGFYLIHSRMWELLTGAIIALLPNLHTKRATNELLSLVGLSLIVYAIAFYDHGTSFPGMAALAPCIGTAMLIWAGRDNTNIPLINRLIANRVFVAIGLISYSMYLWHWPVYVFFNLYHDAPLENIHIAIIILVTFVGAAISWHYIERPFRGKQSPFSRKQIYIGAIIVTVIFCSWGTILHVTNGLPERLSPSEREFISEMGSYHDYLPSRCISSSAPVQGTKLCTFNKSSSDKNGLVLWGDSHAAAFVPGLIKHVGNERPLKFAGMLGCPPLAGASVSMVPRSLDNKCGLFNDYAINAIIADESVSTVVITGYWSLYANGKRLSTDPNHGELYLLDLKTQKPLAIEKNSEILTTSLKATIDKLTAHGKEIIVIGPVPEITINGTTSIARRRMLEQPTSVELNFPEVEMRLKPALDILMKIKQSDNIRIVYPHNVLCKSGTCNIINDGKSIYHDRHHISPYGAEYLWRGLMK